MRAIGGLIHLNGSNNYAGMLNDHSALVPGSVNLFRASHEHKKRCPKAPFLFLQINLSELPIISPQLFDLIQSFVRALEGSVE